MEYKELRKIAEPHIIKGAEIPSNSFTMATQLHLPYKTKEQWDEDFKGLNEQNPLNNVPALLYLNKNKTPTIYFNPATRFWNFYIFHEIAHFLLKHDGLTIQNELDANMLACILIAPLENLPTYLQTARDLSCLCRLPIDKAEEYWQIIKPKLFRRKFYFIQKLFK